MDRRRIIGTNCEGQPFIVDRSVADLLAAVRGPQQRDMRQAYLTGGKATLKYGPTRAETDALIVQQATLIPWKSEDGEARNVTVDVGRLMGVNGTLPGGSLSAPLSYRAIAQVLVATPATTWAPFFIDIGRGQRFTVSASSVFVTAEMLAPRGPSSISTNSATSGTLTVFGCIGEGTALTLAPVLYTQYADQLTSGGAGSISTQVIPPRANLLLPVRCSVANNEITIAFRDPVGNVIDTFTFTNGTMVEPAEIPNDAYETRVTNNAGGSTADFRLVYQLSI